MSSTAYPVPARTHRVEESVKRSRFITTVARAPTAEDAHGFVANIRAEFPDATHHCWAFVAGPPGDTAHIGMSDDGEPHGTAGRPMLNALLHSGVGEIVAVCTRYYGGVKLGTGGLARAYSGGVALVLESLSTRRKVDRVAVTIVAGYPHADALRRRLDDFDALIDDESFASDVTWSLRVAQGEMEELRRAVADLTSGDARFEVR